MRALRFRRCKLILMVFTSGCLFQETSCTQVAASALAGLSTSITDQLVRNSIYQALGLGSAGSLSGLGGLGGLGT